MAVKRKISIRKILQVFVTAVVTTCCITAMVSASRIEDNKKLKSIVVHIKNDKKYHFIEQQEILDLVVSHQQVKLEDALISRLDVRGMEQIIMADPWVANAQVFVDNESVLQMYVTQRIPIARVFDKSNRTYYLDTTLSIMPISSNYIYYATTVTNVPDLNNDAASWALRKDIVTLVRTLQADTFWSVQISQIIVDSAGMYELVPVLGDHRIIFGDLTGMRSKLNNLFSFYKNVLNRIGWDKYETLDLRFRGQVVALPSLPYKGPVDKAVVNMNWINSIVETEARNDAGIKTKDSLKAVDGLTDRNATVKIAPKAPPVKALAAKVLALKALPAKKALVIKKETKKDLKIKDVKKDAKGNKADKKEIKPVQKDGKPVVSKPVKYQYDPSKPAIAKDIKAADKNSKQAVSVKGAVEKVVAGVKGAADSKQTVVAKAPADKVGAGAKGAADSKQTVVAKAPADKVGAGVKGTAYSKQTVVAKAPADKVGAGVKGTADSKQTVVARVPADKVGAGAKGAADSKQMSVAKAPVDKVVAGANVQAASNKNAAVKDNKERADTKKEQVKKDH
jgi:cell division protein FtsQ